MPGNALPETQIVGEAVFADFEAFAQSFPEGDSLRLFLRMTTRGLEPGEYSLLIGLPAKPGAERKFARRDFRLRARPGE